MSSCSLQLLGEGSGGKVYKADLRGSVLAVKTIECYDEKCQKNIDREVNGLKKCIHENIIKMLGLKKDGLTSLIMMEFAECGSLNDYLFPMKGPRQEYSESTAVDWMQQLAKVNSTTLQRTSHKYIYIFVGGCLPA